MVTPASIFMSELVAIPFPKRENKMELCHIIRYISQPSKKINSRKVR